MRACCTATCRRPIKANSTAPPFNSFGWGPRREYLTGLPHFRQRGLPRRISAGRTDLRHDALSRPGATDVPSIPSSRSTTWTRASRPRSSSFRWPMPPTEPIDLHPGRRAGQSAARQQSEHGRAKRWGHRPASALRRGRRRIRLHTATWRWRPMRRGRRVGSSIGSAAPGSTAWRSTGRTSTTPGRFRIGVYAAEQAGDRNEGLLAAHFTRGAGRDRDRALCDQLELPQLRELLERDDVASVTAMTAVVATRLQPPTWKNYYATVWADSSASSRYALENWDRLAGETNRFKDALFASDLPAAALDAVSANISILKSPTVLRLEDGTFYGWEGLSSRRQAAARAAAPMSGTTPRRCPSSSPSWNAPCARPTTATTCCPTAACPSACNCPSARVRGTSAPAADGQFGGVMKIYRDWKICGDDELAARALAGGEGVRSNLPGVPTTTTAGTRTRPACSGAATSHAGHGTLRPQLLADRLLPGRAQGRRRDGRTSWTNPTRPPSTWPSSQRGKAWADEHLFNGEYYTQRIDLTDRSIVAAFEGEDDTLKGGTALKAYWDEEHGEIKYQIGEGSEHRSGAGPMARHPLRPGRDLRSGPGARQASAAIFKYNFIPEHGRGLQSVPHLLSQRRGRPGHLRLARGRKQADHSRALFAGDHERLRVRRRHPHDPERPGRRGHDRGRGHPRSLRRRAAQPVERVRVRQQLRPLHGLLRAAQRLRRLRVRHGPPAHRLRPDPSRWMDASAASGRSIRAGASL